MARKGELIEVNITGLAHKGQAVGRTSEGLVVFVNSAVPGDRSAVRLLRKRKGTWNGVVEELIEPSELREEPKCEHFGICGGCKWQHFSYQGQLEEKEKNVRDSMRRIAGLTELPIEPIIAANPIYQYRNKLEYSFSAKKWRTREEIDSEVSFDDVGALGLHPPRNFQKVVQLEQCWLQPNLSNEIRNFVGAFCREGKYPFFDPLQHTGLMRNMIVRNTLDDQWMVIMSFAYDDPDRREALLDAMIARFDRIISLHYVINEKKNDTLFDQDIILYHGDATITESLGRLRFQIRPKSFFQTNSNQAKVLYDQIREVADIQPTDIVYDLYCGLGSITLYMADLCQHIVGIEEVEDAIKDARINAQLNGVSNTSFYAGDARKVLPSDQIAIHGRPDVVITDPPRGGMHEEVVQKLLALAPRQIIYVSCNPATQARDISLMTERYTLAKMQPVDMFPHTAHIENIASLRRI